MLRKLLFIVLFCFAALCTFAQSMPAAKGINNPKNPSDNTLPADPSKGDFRNLSVAGVGGPTSVTASPGTICSGSSVSLSATCQTGTVIWYNQATGGVSLGTGSPLSQSPTVNTTYYVACNYSLTPTRVTVSESPRVATSLVTVTNVSSPTNVSVNQTSVCNGSSVILTATCASGTVTWYNQASGGSAIGTGTGLIQTPTTATTYYASCVNGTCESGRGATSEINIIPLPALPTEVSVNKTSILSGASVLLSATCVSGSVVWYNQTSAGTEIGVGTSIAYYPTRNTFFYATCRSGKCETERVATSEVTVTAMPQLPYMVTDNINPGELSSEPDELINLNGTLFFITETPEYGRELWKSDGTVEGTVIVKDINPGPETSYVSSLTKVGDLLFFKASDGVNGSELWMSNGKADGTLMVKDITTGSPNTDLNLMTDVNGTAFFTVTDETLGAELWKSDGTVNGTMLVKDIRDGAGSSDPQNLTNVNGTLFFAASDETNGVELWKSDGTTLGTVMVKDIHTGTSNSSSPAKITNANGIVYFIADDGIHGKELWRSDGTSDGTYLVKDITGGSGSTTISYMTSIGNIVYMVANTSESGNELWRSDGTPDGTYLVKDINPGSGGSNITKLVIYDNVLYFGATDGSHGYELWKSDGTLNGTSMVEDIWPGSENSLNSGPVSSDGYVYFIADSGDGNSMLWKTSPDGTEPVIFTNSAFSASTPEYITDVNGKLYFRSTLTDGAINYGKELWSLGTCTDANIIVHADVDAFGKTDYFNTQPGGGTFTETCHCDIYNNLITKTEGKYDYPLSSELNVRQWIDETASASIVRRHYEIRSDGDAVMNAGGTGKITLYFTQADFDAYNTAVGDGGIKLPSNSDDTAGKSKIRIARYAGSSSDDSGVPESYSGEPIIINPDDNDIVWNSELERWEINFDILGLGGFFVQGPTFGKPLYASASPTEVCPGGSVELFGVCEVGSVVWYGQSTGGVSLGSGTSFSVVATQNMRYYAACETDVLKSERYTADTVALKTPPAVPTDIQLSKTTVFIGEEVTLTASCPAGTVFWYGQSSGAGPLSSGSGLVVRPRANKVYYAACRDNGCESAKTPATEIVVTNVLYPPVNQSISRTAMVKGGDVSLYAECPIGNVIWYTQQTGGTSIGTGNPFSYYPSATTTFYAACQAEGYESTRVVLPEVTVTPMEQIPYMVKDINIFQVGADVKNFVALNGNVYFSAKNAENGTELWKSDGTPEGTVLLKDINLGEASSSPANLTLVGNVIYFTARDEEYGVELWKTDGTSGNTVRVKNINPNGDSNPSNFINLNGTLIFSAYTDDEGNELWKSDGTSGGTSLMMDIKDADDSDPKEMTLVGNYVYFTAEDIDYGRELWRINGTNVTRISDIFVGEGSSNPKNLAVMDGYVYFQANDGVNGTELWKVHATLGEPQMVSNINDGEGGSDPANLTVMNGAIYFTANDGINGTELWKSDGTGGGTGIVKDINDGSSGSFPSGLVVFKDMLYFQADNGTNGVELWKSTGEEEGTEILIDINTGASGSNPDNLLPVGDVMYFTATNAINGNELWKTDGNANGTELVKDINTGTGNSSVSNIIVNGSTIYFSADDGSHGAELWKSDGTTGGTALVKDLINRNGNALPSLFLNVAGSMYFLADDGTYGTELWRTDGTADGTYLVRDLNVGSASTNIGWAIDFNGTMYFTANDGVHGEELWKTNGQHFNTELVIDINTNANAGAQIRNLVKANNRMFFAANDGASGLELWVSDGTTDGTVMLKDIREGANGADIRNMTVVGNNVYFSANDGVHGVELWMSDGTYDGTKMVKDIVAGNVGTGLGNLTNVNGTLYFTAETSVYGKELWKSNGTSDGTEIVKDIREGATGTGFDEFKAVSNTLYFLANDGTHSMELWKSDGTGDGTKMVKDIYPGEESSSSGRLAELNGELYFVANDGTHGAEIWKTDGTEEHTVMLKEIAPGNTSTGISSLVNVGDVLYFNADDGQNGNELWRSNGTPEGTVMVKNASDGASSSGPYRLTNVNGKLYYYADPIINGVSYGTELWSLGTCTESNRIVENLELNRYFNKQVQVDPVTATCHCDKFNNLISTTNAVGEAPVSGETDARVWIDTEANAQYVKRHYEINPEENAATATGEITLYFTQEDFQRYSELNNSAIFKLPYSHCEPEDIKYIRIERRGGTSSDNSGTPASYTGEAEIINPEDVDITWNGIIGFWKIKFATKGFGAFFLKAATLTDPDSVSVNTTSICNGSSVTLRASCDAGDLIWYNQASGGSSIGTGTNLSQSPTVNTTYYAACVYEANSSGRVATDEVIVAAVPGIPSGVAAAKTTICSGESATLSASCSTATVLWYGQSSGGSSIGSGTSISVSPGTPGAVYYASCSNGSCVSARVATETITVNATPANPTSVSVDKTAICSGTSVSLTATCATGTVTWYNQASGGSAIGTGTGLSQSPTNSTNYYATCKSGNCETERISTDAITVTTQPASPTSVQASSNAICSGTSVTMSASCSTGSVIWYNQPTGGSSLGTGTSMSLSPLSNITFYASCKSGNCESGRVSTGTIVVTLQPNSPTSVSVNRTEICSGASVSLTATCGTGTINWYNTASGGTAIGTGTGLSQSPSVTTTYYASCKNGICESSRVATSQVVVTAQPTNPTGVTVNSTAICAGATVSLSATCATGAITWYNQSSGGSAIGTGTGLSQSPIDNITYYAACVNGSCISERVATDAITIKPVPVKPVISGLTEICAGEPMALTVSSNNTSISGSITYNWSGGSSGASISISPTTVRMLRVAAVYDGCVSDSSDTFIVTPYEKPIAPTIVADNLTMCNGEVVVLTAECPSMVDAFYWVVTNARPNVPFNPLYRNTRNISSPGTYKGYCLSANGCKSAETSITITQDTDCGAQSFISVAPDKPVICPGSSVTLTASGCTGTISWTGGPSVTTGTSATFSPGTTTTYIVQCSTGGNTTVIVSVAPATATVTKNISTGTSQVKAVNTIEADKKVGDPNYTPSPKVSYEAGKAIILKPGFVAEAGSVFKAEIKTCN